MSMNHQQNENTLDRCNVKLTELQGTMAVYFSLWNMAGQEDASLLYERLMAVQGVLRTDVFDEQGIVVVIYRPDLVTVPELRHVIERTGTASLHFFGADVIGECSAQQALGFKA